MKTLPLTVTKHEDWSFHFLSLSNNNNVLNQFTARLTVCEHLSSVPGNDFTVEPMTSKNKLNNINKFNELATK